VLTESKAEGLEEREQRLLFEKEYKKLTATYVAPFSSALTDPFLLSEREQREAADIFSLGCIVAELFSGRPLFNVSSIADFAAGGPLPEISAVPSSLRPLVAAMLQRQPSSRPAPVDLLHSEVFPSYFRPLYIFCAGWNSRPTMESRLAWTQESHGQLAKLPLQGYRLALPYVWRLFDHKSTQAGAVRLVGAVGSKLGRSLARGLLLPRIISLLESKRSEVLMQLLEPDAVQLLVLRLGAATFLDEVLPFLLDSLRSDDAVLCEQSKYSTLMLCKKLGPVLIVTRVCQPLLQQLAKPGQGQVTETLLALAPVMGVTLIRDHYLPFLYEMLAKHSYRDAYRGEAVLLVLLRFIEGLLPYLSPEAVLKAFVTESSQFLVLLLNPSPSTAVLERMASVLVKIAHYIGLEQTYLHLLPYLQQFFAQYDGLYLPDGSPRLSTEEEKETESGSAVLYSIYSPEMASTLYMQFASLLGHDIVHNEITNSVLIERILHAHPHLVKPVRKASASFKPKSPAASPATAAAKRQKQKGESRQSAGDNAGALPRAPLSPRTQGKSGAGSGSGSALTSVGSNSSSGSLSSSSTSAPSLTSGGEGLTSSGGVAAGGQGGGGTGATPGGKKDPEQRQDQNWIFNFLKEPPTAFSGSVVFQTKAHQGLIKSLAVSDTEGTLATAGHDCQVKLWSLTKRTLALRQTYAGHRRPVHSLTFADCSTRVASSDNTIHVWDAETLSLHYHLKYSAQYRAVQCIDGGTNLIASTILPRLCYIDLSNGLVVHEWGLPHGKTTSMAVSDSGNWLAVGNDGGMVAMLDIRNGCIAIKWKAHEGPVLKLRALGSDGLVSSSTDKSVSVWSGMAAAEPLLVKFIRGHSDAVTNVAVLGGGLLSSSGSRVGIVPMRQERGVVQVNAAKLANTRADRITCLSAMPLHRWFIAGSEEGLLKVIV